jgi:SAM-dependent MidA family methyltransferase
MLAFIKQSGGKVRFDKYMQEHLYGSQGYYSKHAEIGQNKHFFTRSLYPEFSRNIMNYLSRNRLVVKDFLEIGGGTGVFKKNLLNQNNEIKYYSVDLSKKMLKLQALQGGFSTALAPADELPLNTGALNGVVFSNELIDALPCRVFKVNANSKKIEILQELFIYAANNRITADFFNVEYDGFCKDFEQYLNEKRIPASGSIISVAPKTEAVLKEMHRVLNSGVILLFDYGYVSNTGFFLKEFPFYNENASLKGIEHIVANPYLKDITYFVDFEYLNWLCDKNAWKPVKMMPEHEFHGFFWADEAQTGSNVFKKLTQPGNFKFLAIFVD